MHRGRRAVEVVPHAAELAHVPLSLLERGGALRRRWHDDGAVAAAAPPHREQRGAQPRDSGAQRERVLGRVRNLGGVVCARRRRVGRSGRGRGRGRRVGAALGDGDGAAVCDCQQCARGLRWQAIVWRR